MKSKNQRLIFLFAVLPLLFSSCSKSSTGPSIGGPAQATSIPAQVVQVELKEVRRNVDSVGSLFAYEEVTVSAEVEGKVDQVLVDVGDHVAKGQPIVRLSPVELKLALDQHRAAVEQARARLGLAEEGGDFKDVNQAAEVKKALADLHDAEQKYNRAKSLLAEGLLPRQSFDEADARYKSARATYDLAVQSVQNLRAQLVQHQASAELAEKKLADAVIRAPFAGQVKERTVAVGQYLRVQTPVLVIVNVDPLRVRLKIPERMAGWIKVAQPVTITVEAYPDRSFSGEITRINPSVDQQTRSFEVEALIKNNENFLKPGFFVKAKIPSSRVESVLVVPENALRYTYGVYKVFTLDGGVAHEREVKLGDKTDEGVEILEGLSRGERIAVAIEGQELKEGSIVSPVNERSQ